MKRFAIALGLLLSAGTAYAGNRVTNEVVIKGPYAWGSLGSARNAPDSTQYLDIQNSRGFAVLQARTAQGTSAMCVTKDPELLAIARSASGDSYVYFSWDASGSCTDILVSAASYLAPKAP
jgi:hypothetical protein